MAALTLRSHANSSDELDKVCRFLQSIWPEPDKLTRRYLEWLYAECPDGAAIGANAWDGDALVGHYVVVPARARLSGTVVKAAVSLHTAIHPAHRGKGLFVSLAKATYEQALAQGIDHVFGCANENSTHGMTKSLGFQLVAPLELRALSRWPAIDDALDDAAVWRRDWSPAALAWRLAHPQFSYRRRERRGFVYDLLLRKRAQSIVRIARDPISAAPPPARAQLTLPFPRVWVGLRPGIRFRGPHASLPPPIRTSPLNLIFRSLSSPSTTIDAKRVVFEGLDFDVF